MRHEGEDQTVDSDLRELLGRLRGRGVDGSTCFLCARHLGEVEPSSEHVIPSWAQRRYNLWNQRLTLLNGTSIRYRQLTVPCCAECNKYRLKPIEDAVAGAVAAGPDGVRALGSKVMFLWLGKILYGVLYKEASLLLDRSTPSGVTIVSPELLRAYDVHLMLLQQAREKIELVDFCPGSIFVFGAQKTQDRRLDWDLCDNIDTFFIAVRMGEVAVIGALADGGAQQAYADLYSDLLDLPLHPLQFRELCAQFCYRSTLATRVPKYVTMEGQPHQTFQLPLGGFSLTPLFDDWDPATYAQYLAYYTGQSYEEVFQAPDRVTTWLHDHSGKPVYLDFDEYPYLPAARPEEDDGD
jgi:hypothetical protein